ncbi:MAG TPA: hypothetical protein VHF50_04500 [Solirubrobacterales bacterium]|nr:hypothetical protein [Solirubrobacterales bacterium]
MRSWGRRGVVAVLALLGLAVSPASTWGEPGPPPSVTTGRGVLDWTSEGRDLHLSGTVNPNGSSTGCLFEYGPNDFENPPGPYGHTAPCREVPGSGTAPVEVTAVVPGAAVPADAAGHFRLVATNPYGTAYGEDQPILALVCYCPRPPDLVPSRAFVHPKAPIRKGLVRVRVSCRGGETGCGGEVQLIARKKRGARGIVREIVLGEEDYGLEVDTSEIVPIVYPKRSRPLLERRPSEVRFVLDGPELERRVVELTRVGFRP